MKTKQSSKNNRVISFIPDGEYYFQRGITAYRKGDLYRAKKFVGRAIVFNPSDSEYLCQQAAILAELEEYEDSNQLLKKVVYEIDETITDCYFFMANNLAHIGHYEQALHEVKNYMTHEPNGTFIEEAHELYKILLEESEDPFLDEEDYILDHEKGRQALERGEFWEAIAYFQKVIASQPSYWAAYNNLAIAYFAIGQSKRAFDVIEEVLNEDPGNIHALCNRITFYFQLGQQEQVESYYPTLMNLYPLYPEHRSKLGATFFFLGDYEQAYRWLKSAENAGVWDQSFYYWLALSAFRLGKEAIALKAWEKVDFFSNSAFDAFEYGKIRDMLASRDAKDNPLVYSLLEQQLKEGELSTKTFSLFLLNHFDTPRALDLIKAVRDNRTENVGLRHIAAVLLNKGEETSEMWIQRINVMKRLEEHLGNGAPLVDDYELYHWWKILCDSDFEIQGDAEISAWAAALEYLWQKGQDKAISQAEVASKYDTTLYRVRKLLVRLQRMMSER